MAYYWKTHTRLWISLVLGVVLIVGMLTKTWTITDTWTARTSEYWPAHVLQWSLRSDGRYHEQMRGTTFNSVVSHSEGGGTWRRDGDTLVLEEKEKKKITTFRGKIVHDDVLLGEERHGDDAPTRFCAVRGKLSARQAARALELCFSP
jgi:hypothetical protein